MHLVEAGQVLGRHGQVGVEDHQHVAAWPRRSPGAPRRPCPCRSGGTACARRSGWRGDLALDGRAGVVAWSGPRRRSARCRAPISGTRSKIAAMLPASLRAGTTTETVGSCRRCRRGAGRATMKLVRARCRKGQSRTRKRLHSGASRGTGSGSSTSCQWRTGWKPASRRRFSTSATVSQFCGSAGWASPRRAAEGQRQLPEPAVEVEDHPRPRVGERRAAARTAAATSQASLIRSERMMTSNVSPASAGPRSWASAWRKRRRGVALARPGRTISPERSTPTPSGGLEGGQQVARAAADLQHP